MRQIVLDTETTGLEPSQGHRIIEIGCVELVNRRFTQRNFHHYLNPGRDIDEGAMEVHGITMEQLADKPGFQEIAQEFLDYVNGAELIIHNAPFDVGFLDHELALTDAGYGRLGDYCSVLDTLAMARSMHPGQRNNLDALCKRYDVNNSERVLHGALLDAEILADVYLRMTGGQVSLFGEAQVDEPGSNSATIDTKLSSTSAEPLKVQRASEQELARHEAFLERMEQQCGGESLWRKIIH